MSAKSIFIIVVTILLTVVLMNNNEEMSFWLFGEARVPKLAVLSGVFFAGWLIGFLMGRPKAKNQADQKDEFIAPEQKVRNTYLSEEDQDYIS